jgi:hypothetical protein
MTENKTATFAEYLDIDYVWQWICDGPLASLEEDEYQRLIRDSAGVVTINHAQALAQSWDRELIKQLWLGYQMDIWNAPGDNALKHWEHAWEKALN